MSNVANATAAMRQFDGSEASIIDAVAAIDGYHVQAVDPVSGEFLIELTGVVDDPFAA